MLISLVVATRGRTRELARLLTSLAAQDHGNFEVIVADNNGAPDFLGPLLKQFENRLSLHHVMTRRGLSNARNDGMRHINGQVAGFPDDDCWFPPGLLSNISRLLRDNPDWSGLSCVVSDPDSGGEPPLMSRWSRWVSPVNAIDRCISISLFFRREVLDSVGRFDETLGVGAHTPWGSGEETDYVYRALDQGFKLRFCPALLVHHPIKDEVFDQATCRRGYAYGAGMGRILRKNRLPAWYVASMLLRAGAGAMLGALTGRLGMARYHGAVLRGRWRGFWDPTPFNRAWGPEGETGTNGPARITETRQSGRDRRVAGGSRETTRRRIVGTDGLAPQAESQGAKGNPPQENITPHARVKTTGRASHSSRKPRPSR